MSVQVIPVHVFAVVSIVVFVFFKAPVLQRESLQHVTKVLQHVKGTIRASIASSKWFNGSVGTYALQKLDQIKLRIGAPDYPNLTLESVADFYKDLPDTNVDVLFTSWIKAVALTARLKWVDKTTYRFDITKPNAFFHPGTSSVVIPAAIIMRPFFFSVETDPLNYGGVGALVGHETMHAFDVTGIMLDARGVTKEWTTPEFLQEYTKRALCLRRSHQTAAKPQARQQIDDTTDSENLSDLVGLMAAYAAFNSLPQPQRSMTLAGVNFTADQLFFISFCTQRCTDESQVTQSPRYAPFASRCNVPLMNMPAFSNAFGCAPGDPMNPKDKCTFWE